MTRFVLMAGGTGGHLFPAMALAQEMKRRGHVVDLMTDERVADYGAAMPVRDVHVVPAATPSVRNPIRFATAGAVIGFGIGVASAKLGSIKPEAVVGFGGYPTFPPFLAARLRGIPGLLHEQNAVMGRANRALARLASGLALSFAETRHAEGFARAKAVTGNPVRDQVRALASAPYVPPDPGGPVRLLVFGGSQGARAFADLVPPAIAALPGPLRARLVLTQQCRPEDLDRVTRAYADARVNVELQPFFADLPERMAQTHLVIGRSGASTVAELTVLGRPSILVPLPGSLDADQKSNALVVEAAGGGWIAEQATLSPQSLATRLQTLLGDPAILRSAAERARTLGQPDAVQRLADFAERIAQTKAHPKSTGTPS